MNTKKLYTWQYHNQKESVKTKGTQKKRKKNQKQKITMFDTKAYKRKNIKKEQHHKQHRAGENRKP